MSLGSFCKKLTKTLVSDYNTIAKSHHLLHCLIVAIRVKGINMVFALNESILYILLCEVDVVLSTVKMLGVFNGVSLMPQDNNIGIVLVRHEESGLFLILSDDTTLTVRWKKHTEEPTWIINLIGAVAVAGEVTLYIGVYVFELHCMSFLVCVCVVG